MTNDRLVPIEVRAEVIDVIVKSLMQSITANASKRRRLRDPGVAREGQLLDEALDAARKAQQASWDR